MSGIAHFRAKSRQRDIIIYDGKITLGADASVSGSFGGVKSGEVDASKEGTGLYEVNLGQVYPTASLRGATVELVSPTARGFRAVISGSTFVNSTSGSTFHIITLSGSANAATDVSADSTIFWHLSVVRGNDD